MLTLRKSSWHYKLTYAHWCKKLFNQKDPTDLCTYMRQLLKPVLGSVGLVMGLAGASLNIFMMYTYGPGGEESWPWPTVDSMLLNIFGVVCVILGWIEIVVVIVVAIVVALIGLITFIDNYIVKPIKAKIKEKRGEQPTLPPEPNLFIEWVKACKQKTCPLIEVVDE